MNNGFDGAAFGRYVAGVHAHGGLVVQPRTGMSDPGRMRTALLSTKHAAAATAGTITVDSYTRLGDHESVRRALVSGDELNGYPIVAHGAEITGRVLDGVRDADFPVQVRHGSARPQDIFRVLSAARIDASEGGPVSYCLPYGRTPLAESVVNWARCCALFEELGDVGVEPHLETFGGCMLGQLCPPSLLVAVSVLEGMFFRQNGIRSISLSYAQQTNAEQDTEAILALRRLADELLPDVDWHVVVYTYMGMYPRSERGARMVLEDAARLAIRSGAARLIVKTAAEALRIPTVAENVTALEIASKAAENESGRDYLEASGDTETYREARTVVDAVLELDDDIGRALVRAFARGYVDVPYCLHPDNAGRTSSYIAQDGRLRWASTGSMPIGRSAGGGQAAGMTSSELLTALSYVERKYDGESPELGDGRMWSHVFVRADASGRERS